MKFKIFYFLLVCLSTNVYSQGEAWTSLGFVNKVKAYDPNLGYDVETVSATAIAQKLNGEEITVSGYIIPLTGKVEQSHFMFSKFPQNMCFFCGKAGPESAMQVFTKDDLKVKFTMEKIKIKGRLLINNDPASGLLYTLNNAEIINE